MLCARLDPLARVVFLVLALTPFAGCKKSSAPAAASSAGPESSEVVARIGSEVITLAELEAHIRELPAAAQSAQVEPAQRRRLVEQLARNELLELAARERGLDRDPRVVRVIQQALVSRLLEREIDEKLAAMPVAPVDVDRYLKEHPDELARREEVRIALILCKGAAQARRIAGLARSAKTIEEFERLARDHAEDAACRSEAGQPFFAADSKEQPKALIEAAFALAAPGEIAGPVQTERGFAILRLIEKRPGYSHPLEQVRPRIEAKLRAQLRAKEVERLLAELRAKHPIQIEEENLKR